MEESIKRVEKVIHATNSALAQMKFSLMFDDVGGIKSGTTLQPEGFDRMLVNKILEGDNLKQCQDEFQLEANKMLAKVENMFSSNDSNRKTSKVLDRIKEINKKMNKITSEQSKPEETEQSRQKLLSLINEEKFSPKVSSSKGSVGSKPIVSFNKEKASLEKTQPVSLKSNSLFSIVKSPNKSKMELKNKILETEEIVDRGFLTARQLAQKVEWMMKDDRKEKTPSTDKTVSEQNSRSLENKTGSTETIRAAKCRRHSGKKKREVQEVEQINTQVIDVKRREYQRGLRPNLQLQRLPSVHIKGGLKLQTIHNLEIPASDDTLNEKFNTAVSFLSHEQINKKKMEKIIEKVRRENRFCIEENIQGNYVECFNCGKLTRIRETWADPRKIDEVLHQCNFNVFDPRIDEFAEKFGAVGVKNWCEKTLPQEGFQSDVLIPKELEIKSVDGSREKIKTIDLKEQPKEIRPCTLREFSSKIFKKYQKEAETLQDNHLKLDSILQNLFKKVEESREFFKDCPFFRNLPASSEKMSNLTCTKPILVTVAEKKRKKNFNKKDLDENKSGIKSSETRKGDKKLLYATSSKAKSPELKKSVREGISSFIHLNQDGNVKSKPNATELQRKFIANTDQTLKTNHSEKKDEAEEKFSSVTSILTNKSWSANQRETSLKQKNIEKALVVVSSQKKAAESLGWICKAEGEKVVLNRSSTYKTKTTEPSNTRKDKSEEEKTPNVTTSVSSNRSRKTYRENLPSVQSTVKGVSKNKDVEKESFVILPGNKIDSEGAETSSEKSENIYESDFESFTNEPEEKGNECEGEEPELIPCAKKLSTISEVDSELEKKLSDELKTPKSIYSEVNNSHKAFETGLANITQQESGLHLLKQKEGNSVTSDISSEAKKTSEASPESTSTELVTSLRDILSALQDQFAKTESLAEKLTETVKIEKEEKGELDLAAMTLNAWKMASPAKMVENLQSARKDWSCTSKSSLSLITNEKIGNENSEKSEKDSPADNLSNEGGSSLGEIIVRNSRKPENTLSESSFLNLDT